MNRKRIGVLAGVIVALCLLVRTVPDVVLGRLMERGPPAWVPTFGTVGQTVVLYSNVVDIVGPLTAIALTVGFGYVVGQRISIEKEYRPVFRAVAIGVSLPPVLVGVAAIGATVLWSYGPYSVAITTLLVLRVLVTVSLPVFVGTLAGVALAHFSSRGSPPARGEGDSTASPATTE